MPHRNKKYSSPMKGSPAWPGRSGSRKVVGPAGTGKTGSPPDSCFWFSNMTAQIILKKKRDEEKFSQPEGGFVRIPRSRSAKPKCQQP